MKEFPNAQVCTVPEILLSQIEMGRIFEIIFTILDIFVQFYRKKKKIDLLGHVKKIVLIKIFVNWIKGASINYIDKQGGGRGSDKFQRLLHKLI